MSRWIRFNSIRKKSLDNLPVAEQFDFVERTGTTHCSFAVPLAGSRNSVTDPRIVQKQSSVDAVTGCGENTSREEGFPDLFPRQFLRKHPHTTVAVTAGVGCMMVRASGDAESKTTFPTGFGGAVPVTRTHVVQHSVWSIF